MMDARSWKFSYWYLISCFLSILFLNSCEKEIQKIVNKNEKPKVVFIQPFEDMNANDVEIISENIRKIYPNVKVLESIPFPKNSYYQPRNRYRADSIIAYLKTKTAANAVTLGLTSKDISATKGKNPDFGIMGLGYRPGNACVASCFRLTDKNRNEQFYKIAIHELGHTQGLPHCPQKTCFMRDAEGGNPTDEEKDFCPKCKEFLKTKNWKFS